MQTLLITEDGVEKRKKGKKSLSFFVGTVKAWFFGGIEVEGNFGNVTVSRDSCTSIVIHMEPMWLFSKVIASHV